MKQRLASHPDSPGSPQLAAPRSRTKAALDKAVAALTELLAITDLADELAAELSFEARRRAGVAEGRHYDAKLKARTALLDIGTLRGDGR